MILPLVLIFLATVVGVAVAYGTHPDWVLHAHGMSVITTMHRLEWPLIFLAIILCVLIIALVASGKRRIFWLLGLAPVSALLFHHLRSDPLRAFEVLDNPPFVAAADAGALVADDDYVIGLRLADTWYAYPYSLLYANPVVIQSDRGKRLLLMWSPFANRATAAVVDHDVQAREFDIVSMPANAILVYNSRLGQFINGVTGMTPKGDPVTGVVASLPITKTTWRQWRTMHADTRVLAVQPRYAAGLPRRAIEPYFKVPATADLPPETRVTLVGVGSPPVAITSDQVTSKPINLTPDAGAPVVMFRDPASGVIRAFDRRFEPDLSPEFRPVSDPKRPGVAFVDSATNTGWSLGGFAVDGDAKFKGRKLVSVPVDEDLPYAVMKFWYPGLTVQHLNPEDYATAVDGNSSAGKPDKVAPVRRRRTPRAKH